MKAGCAAGIKGDLLRENCRKNLYPMKHKIIGCLLFVMLAFVAGVQQAVAQGTAFTYQGRLDNGTNPANGNYDLTFSLYSAQSGGSQTGPSLTNLDVSVSNGLFLVTEDFGAVYDGASYWLQIGVRTNGASSFTALTSRQALTPAPYAVYAESSGSSALITDPGSQNFFAGQLAGNQSVTGTHNTGVGYGALSANTGGDYNTAIGDSSLLVNTTGSGNTADGVFALWKNTTGANNTTMGADAMAYNTSGVNNTSIGEGALENNTTGSNNVALGALAMVNSTADTGIVAIGYQALQSDAFTPGFFGSSASVAIGYQSLQSTTTGGFNTAVGYASLNDNTTGLENTALGLNALFDNTTGENNIGIGVAAGEYITTGGNNIDIGNQGASGDNNLIRIGTAGTQTDAYIAGNLHVVDGLNVDQNSENNGTVTSNALNFGQAGSGEGIASNRTTDTNRYGLDFYTDYNCRMSITQQGNVGIGARDPSQALEVNGNFALIDGGDANDGDGAIDAYIGGNGSGSDVQIGSFNSSIANVALYNWGNSTYMHLYCSAITITGGSDLAEPFKISASSREIPQGSVVVIDDENPGKLKVSSEPYDTRVAGVLSGANGVNPGIQMQQQGVLEGGKNVALTGRVYVLADASNGAIKPGDMLTTSATPGHAMKVTDHARASGAILGKAMTGLKQGKGMVLVLVTLQ
jgi:hypothetical protein